MKNLQQLIPPEYLFTIVNIKNSFLSGFKQEHYSQTGEDIIIDRILSKTKNWFYVDVGAFHPKHYSNTYLLYKKGWNGINIDPNPASIKLFKKERKNDINLQLGISENEVELKYYKFSHASCNTFSSKQALKQQENSWIKLIGTEEVKCLPLRDVLKKYLPSKQKIGLLNIDVEGFDLEVLRSSDWEHYRPHVIVVEASDFNPSNPEENEIFKFLKKRSYSLQAFTGLSLIFTTQID